VASKRRRGSGRKPAAHPARPSQKHQSFRERAFSGSAKWIGGIATAAVVAAVTAVVTALVTADVTTAQGTAPAPVPPTLAAGGHGPPVRIDSVTVLRTTSQAGTYVFQRPLHLSPQELAALNRLQDGTPAYDAWFRSRGGVDPSPSSIQLVVNGNASQPARITDVTLVKSCRPQLTGTLFDSPSAGNQGSILLDFNLDSARTIAQTPNGQDYFANFTISLEPGEVQVLQIYTTTSKYFCQFTLQLTVLVGSHQTTETVTDDGKPFQVTAATAPVKDFQVVYAGGVETSNGYFVPENPRKFQG